MLQLSRGDFVEYEIIYAKRKSLSLQIKPDLSIVVRAPFGTSKKYIDDFVIGHNDWINKKINEISSRSVNPYSFSGKEINDLKKKTLEIVLPRVEYYSRLMGFSPNKVSVSSAKRRFASCSSCGHLNFSFRLCLYPDKAIDYVVVHELAHLKEMNHSKRFWAIVEKFMPDYKERQKLLKE